MFADDTLLLLDGTSENLDRALEVIRRFGNASGARLNLHKSIGLWVANIERPWQWGVEAGLKWIQPGEVTRYLGYPFGLHIAQKEKDTKMLSQIRKHLARWAGNKLSLAGRIMVGSSIKDCQGNCSQFHLVWSKRILRSSSCQMGHSSATYSSRRDQNPGSAMAGVSTTGEAANPRAVSRV
jgi:hypothetical protein